MRTEQAHHIGTHCKGKAGENLFADGGAANDRSLLEYKDALAGFGEISRTRESIMSAADNNSVVARMFCLVFEFHHSPHAFFLGGSKNGVLVTTAGTRRRSYSTVTSICRTVPGFA